MFGGHIPEEPTPARGDMGDFGVKLNPEKMPEALKDGTVSEAAVTRAAGRVLYEIVHFGYMDGMQKHSVTKQDIDENAKIIEKTGEDAAVLLKNEARRTAAQGGRSWLRGAHRPNRRADRLNRHQWRTVCRYARSRRSAPSKR